MDAANRSGLRRLPPYLYLADLLRGRRVLELGCGAGRGARALAALGAASVLAVDASRARVEQARAGGKVDKVDFRAADYAALGIGDRSVDVVCIAAEEQADLLRAPGVLEEVHRVLAPNGLVIVAVGSVEAKGTQGGLGYHELHGRLAPLFGAVRMIGVSPFEGVSLVEYGTGGREAPQLDTSLTKSTPAPVAAYVAVAGPLDGPARGLTVVQFPVGAALAIDESDLKARLAQREAELAESLAERQVLAWRAAELEAKAGRPGELPTMVSRAGLEHERAMQARVEELAERDAYVEELREELERSTRASVEAARAAAEAVRRAEQAEHELAQIRSHAAIAEGELLRLRLAPPVVVAAEPATDPRLATIFEQRSAELEAQVVDKQAQAEKFQKRWKEAETKSDELWRKVGEMQRDLEQHREQGVETARQQRQAAQVALTRAVDEASKKLVSTQDQLLRTERERKTLEKTVHELRAEGEGLRAQLAQAEVAQAQRQSLAAVLASRFDELDELVRILAAGLRNEELHLATIEDALRSSQESARALANPGGEGESTP